MSDHSPKVSVIIPTYNGAKKIINTLHALNNQTYKDFEIIVAIDGSTDNTEKVIENLKFNFKGLVIVKQKNGGRSSIRNFGAHHGEGQLLIFFDDDMRPEKNCVEIHVNHHLKHLSSIFTGSQIEDYSKLHSDIQIFKAKRSRDWEKPIANLNRPLLKNELHMTAANFSISKSLFFKLGGFDERLTDIEDLDLAIRAYLNDIPIFFNMNAIGWHDDFINCRSYILRRREYSKALKKLIELKPKHSKFLEKKVIKRSIRKKIIYNVFSQRFWIKVIDIELLTFLPKGIRYKIYQLTIWGLSNYFPSRTI